jgi:ribosome-binding factor A
MQSVRREKVADMLVAEISDILRTRVKDPRLGFVTITDVEMTKDLRIAKVFFSVLGSEIQRADSIKALESAKSFIQIEVGSRIRLKFLPQLIFRLDTSIEYGARIETLITQIHKNENSHRDQTGNT